MENYSEIKLREEFIKLGQALKASGIAESGVDAKFIIAEGKVTVNDMIECRRGRKLYSGDIIKYDNKIIRIV